MQEHGMWWRSLFQATCLSQVTPEGNLQEDCQLGCGNEHAVTTLQSQDLQVSLAGHEGIAWMASTYARAVQSRKDHLRRCPLGIDCFPRLKGLFLLPVPQ